MDQISRLLDRVRFKVLGPRNGIEFVKTYEYPDAVLAKFAREHPEIGPAVHRQVFEALRNFFLVCAVAPDAVAGMPSRIVDEAWHTFILFTREYARFCERAFGRYLHHTPDEAMTGTEEPQAALGRTWRLACASEGIDPKRASRLPLLFAIDRRLKVENGRYWVLNETDGEVARRMIGANAIVQSAIILGAVGQGTEGDGESAYAARLQDGGEMRLGGCAGAVDGVGGCAGSGDGGGAGCGGGGGN